MALSLRKCWPLIALLCVGAALRLVWIHEVQPSPTHDASWYVARAQNFAAGHGMSLSDRPTAYRPVGYPVLLGLTYKVFHVGPSVHRYLNVVISVMTLLCLYVAARHATRSRRAAYAAALLFACYPTDVAYTALAVSEPLFNLCMMGGAAAWSMHRRRLGLVLCGGCLFAAAMARANGVILPVLIGCFGACASTASSRSRWTRLGLLLVIVTALLVPWWLRNQRAFHGFVPIANNGGVNLYIGNNPLATGGYRLDRKVLARLPREVAGGWLGSGGPKEYQIDRTLQELASTYMIEHPRATLALWPAKLRYLFASDHTAFEWTRSRDFRSTPLFEQSYAYSRFYYFGLWILAGAATVALLWRNGPVRAPMLAYACIGAFTIFQLIYFGDARFHHALMPWVCVSAGAGVARLAREKT